MESKGLWFNTISQINNKLNEMIIKQIKKLANVIYIKLHEKKYQNRLRYLFCNNNSDVLFVVFPAFTGEKRRYNYIKGLMRYKVDKLFLLDDFGVKGSYLLFEDGDDTPRKLTIGLLSELISKKKYEKTIFMGTSKGGSCAIYYGLEFNANYILAGACQYNLGSYLHREDPEDIFKGMMGQNASQQESDILNKIMPNQLKKHSGSNSFVFNIYSEKELTYQRQIIDLNKKMKECNIKHENVVLDFENHDDVGIHFLQYIHKNLSKLITK